MGKKNRNTNKALKALKRKRAAFTKGGTRYLKNSGGGFDQNPKDTDGDGVADQYDSDPNNPDVPVKTSADPVSVMDPAAGKLVKTPTELPSIEVQKPEVAKAGVEISMDYRGMAEAAAGKAGKGATVRWAEDKNSFIYQPRNAKPQYLTPREVEDLFKVSEEDFKKAEKSITTKDEDIEALETEGKDISTKDRTVTATDVSSTGAGLAQAEESPFGYDIQNVVNALEKSPEFKGNLARGDRIRKNNDGTITIFNKRIPSATITRKPEDIVNMFSLEGDFGASGKAAQVGAVTVGEGEVTVDAATRDTEKEIEKAAGAKISDDEDPFTVSAAEQDLDEDKVTDAKVQVPTTDRAAKTYASPAQAAESYGIDLDTIQDPEVRTRTENTISEREAKDVLDIVSSEGVDLEKIPEFIIANQREAQVGVAAKGIEEKLGETPSVDLQGRRAITGDAPKGTAAQIGGVPTLAASQMQAVTGEARQAAAADMMSVVGNMPPEITAAVSEDPATVEAQLDDPNTAPEVKAAVAALPQEALVSVQMENLLAGMEEGKTPAWARPAVAAIEQQMARRGLSVSTVGRDALFNAIIQSALPMAQSNAQALQQRAQQNLSNEQQANLASAQNVMQIRMQNLSNRQTAASQTAQMAQQIKMQQGQFEQEAVLTTAQQEQQVRMVNIQNAQQKASQESSQRQQTALANLDAGSRMDLANLEALNLAGRENLNAAQQSKLASYQANVNRIMRQAELTQDMEKANLDSSLRMEMMNLTEKNAAARDSMTAENQERLVNLQNLVDFKKTNASMAQQMELANMSNEQQMEMANLAERAATDSANFTEANRFRLQELTTYVNVMSQNEQLRQNSELAKLSAQEKITLANLTSKNQADSENMTATNVANLQNFEKRMQAAQVNAQLAQQLGLADLSNAQSSAMLNAQLNANLDMKDLDFEQQAAIANSQFMQTLTLKNLDNRQQAALQEATLLSQRDIAEADLATKASIENARNFLQRDLTDLGNEQQSSVLEAQLKQQRLLSNQAAQNAAKQFNATSDNQMQQFVANLESNLRQFNVSQANNMSQFNLTEKNRMAAIDAGNDLEAAKFTEQLSVQVDQYNAENEFRREQWNAANAQAIEQSNIQWRRQANLATTAAENAANQEAARQSFQLTTTEQNFMWQQLRDEVSYLRQGYENDQQRRTTLFATALANEGESFSSKNIQTLVTGIIDALGGD